VRPSLELAKRGQSMKINSRRVDIVITSAGFKIDNETYSSRSSLALALATKGIEHVRLLPEKDAGYKQVEAAVGAAQDAGVDV